MFEIICQFFCAHFLCWFSLFVLKQQLFSFDITINDEICFPFAHAGVYRDRDQLILVRDQLPESLLYKYQLHCGV